MENEMPFCGEWDVREYSFRTINGWETAFTCKEGEWRVKVMPDGGYISLNRVTKLRKSGSCSFDPQSGILAIDGIAAYVPDSTGGRNFHLYCFENKPFIPQRREVILEHYAEGRYSVVKVK